MSRRGRIIEKMECRTGDGGLITVPIRMIMTSDYSDSETTFRATLEEMAIDIRNADLNELRNQVRQKAEASQTIVWTPILVINETNEVSEANECKCDITLSVGFHCSAYLIAGDDESGHQHMQVGIESVKSGQWDGTRLQHSHPVKRKIHLTDPDDPDEDTWSIGTGIPATAENYEAIQRIREAFEVLASRLAELIKPQNIAGFLEQTTAGKILPDLQKEK